jgi:hypothetical protein
MRHLAGMLLMLALAACADEASETDGPDSPGQRELTSPNCLDTDSNDSDPVDVQTYDPGPTDSAWDNDCDGYPRGRPDGTSAVKDCNDNNPIIHPGAPEYNNGVDANCDGVLEPLYGCNETSYAAFGPWFLLLLGGRRRREHTP